LTSHVIMVLKFNLFHRTHHTSCNHWIGVFFKPLKCAYNAACSSWLRKRPARRISVDKIAELFKESYHKAATMESAVSGLQRWRVLYRALGALVLFLLIKKFFLLARSYLTPEIRNLMHQLVRWLLQLLPQAKNQSMLIYLLILFHVPVAVRNILHQTPHLLFYLPQIYLI